MSWVEDSAGIPLRKNRGARQCHFGNAPSPLFRGSSPAWPDKKSASAADYRELKRQQDRPRSDLYRGLRDIISGDIGIFGQIDAIGEVGVQAFAGNKKRRLAGAKDFGLNLVGFEIVADFVTCPDLFIPLDEYLAFGKGLA